MPDPFTVLVFSKTATFRHQSIPAGVAMFRRLAEASKTSAHPYVIEASEDAEATFTPANLARYRVIVLLSNSGDFLTAAQLAALEGYVRSSAGSAGPGSTGGGVVGIHSASYAMQSTALDPTGFYGRLLGGVFTSHPEPQLGRIIIKAPTHPIVSVFLHNVSSSYEASAPEPSFSHFDEWYNFTATSCAVVAATRQLGGRMQGAGPHVLLAADEETFDGGTLGDDHPIALTWPDFEGTGTRVFYTALGHFDEPYEEDETFAAHLENGVLWAAKLL